MKDNETSEHWENTTMTTLVEITTVSTMMTTPVSNSDDDDFEMTMQQRLIDHQYIVNAARDIVTTDEYINAVAGLNRSNDDEPMIGRKCLPMRGIDRMNILKYYHLEFNSSNSSSCGYYKNSYLSSADLYSQNFPRQYSNNLKCEYKLICPDNQLAQVEFDYFQTEEGSDYVHLNDATNNIRFTPIHYSND